MNKAVNRSRGALEQMKMNVGEELISKYTIVKLEVDGECVYPKEYHKQVNHYDFL